MKRISADSTHIRITFPYDFGTKEIIKTIADRAYATEPFRHWTLPATPWHAQELLTKLKGAGFVCDDEVRKLYAQNHYINHLNPRKDALGLGLYPFQAQAVDFIDKCDGRVMVCDDAGLGKTVTSLGYIRLHDIQRVLIVAPASVIYKWRDECHRWLVDPDVAVVETSKKEIPFADILILSYRLMTLLKDELTQQVFDCIIFDESHYIKNHKAQRTQAAKEIAIGNPYLLCLSGTPLLNRPIEMFEALHLLQPSSWPSRQSYGWAYCGGVVHAGPFKKVFQGTCNEEELAERVRSIMIRRLKQDVKDQLPELTRSVLPVDIDKGAYTTAYHEDYPNALTKLTALRYAVGMAKAKVAASWADDFLFNSEENTKLVLYCHHLDVVDYIKDRLKKYLVVTITGKVSSKERDRRIKMYQTPGGPRIMIITSAGGEGIDLFGLDGVDSSNICFVEREWNSAKEEQAEARLHRLGQDNAVVAWYLIARNTIDEDVAELIEEKRRLIGRIVGVGDVEASIVTDLLKRIGD